MEDFRLRASARECRKLRGCARAAILPGRAYWRSWIWTTAGPPPMIRRRCTLARTPSASGGRPERGRESIAWRAIRSAWTLSRGRRKRSRRPSSSYGCHASRSRFAPGTCRNTASPTPGRARASRCAASALSSSSGSPSPIWPTSGPARLLQALRGDHERPWARRERRLRRRGAYSALRGLPEICLGDLWVLRQNAARLTASR